MPHPKFTRTGDPDSSSEEPSSEGDSDMEHEPAQENPVNTLDSLAAMLLTIDRRMTKQDKRAKKFGKKMVTKESLSRDLDQLKEDLRLEAKQNIASEVSTQINAQCTTIIRDELNAQERRLADKAKDIDHKYKNSIGKTKDEIIKDPKFLKVVSDTVAKTVTETAVDQEALNKIKQDLQKEYDEKFNKFKKEMEAARRTDGRESPCDNILVEANDWFRLSDDYNMLVNQARRLGLVRMVLLDQKFYKVAKGTNGDADKFTILTEEIGKAIKSTCRVDGPVLTSHKGNPMVQMKLTGKDTYQMFGHVKEVIENRKHARGLAISSPTPKKYNIDKVLYTWIEAKQIINFDTTKSGHYVIFINDGDENLKGNLTDQRIKKEYHKSCTHMRVCNPAYLSRCTIPSIQNLRKIARGTHFVTWAGNVCKFPQVMLPRANRYKSREVNDKNPANDDDNQANQNLINFLRAEGLNAQHDK